MNTKKPTLGLLTGNPPGSFVSALAKLALLGAIAGAAQEAASVRPCIRNGTGKRKAQWKEERNKR